MLQSRSVSNLQSEFSNKYSKLTDELEIVLDKADRHAAENIERMSHAEVFGEIRRKKTSTIAKFAPVRLEGERC